MFELDYAKFMGLVEVRKKAPNPKHGAQKRAFGERGGNARKKYRRF